MRADGGTGSNSTGRSDNACESVLRVVRSTFLGVTGWRTGPALGVPWDSPSREEPVASPALREIEFLALL
ncbi:MAG: hypothetical protein WBG19_02445 [Thermoplasmata archaeon]